MDIEFHNWIVEQADSEEIHLFKRVGPFEACQTKFQSVAFATLPSYGKTLILDGALQSSESDEYLYHEALVHPGMLTHPNPRRVMVIGGGEGATLREVFKYESVESVVMVDIDEELVNLCKKQLTAWHQGSFDHPKLTLIHTDGRAYLQENPEKFDVIIVDITDILTDGPAIALYTKEFYALCRERLTPDGVLVVQALELSSTDWAEHATLARTVQQSFSVVRSYLTFVPSFICTWGYLVATNGADTAQLSPAEIDNRIATRNLASRLRAYDGLMHFGMFCLSKDLRHNLARPGGIIADGQPLIFDNEDGDSHDDDNDD